MDSIAQIKTNWKQIILDYPHLDSLLHNMKVEKKKFQGHLKIFPPNNLIFECFNHFNVEDTKVLILGQDPYHGEGQACGLCFAVPTEKKAPPSLNNIRNELVLDCGIDLKSTNLKYWALQGVLLLNGALTVLEKKPTSFLKMWAPFTRYIIDYLNKAQYPIVFVAWGAFAYTQLSKIDKTKHHLIVSSHPSPLSAYRKYKTFHSFHGSKPFSTINSLLKKPIHW